MRPPAVGKSVAPGNGEEDFAADRRPPTAERRPPSADRVGGAWSKKHAKGPQEVII